MRWSRQDQSIRDAEQTNGFPPVPGEGAVCRECHLGKPKLYRKGEQFLRHQSPLPAHGEVQPP